MRTYPARCSLFLTAVGLLAGCYNLTFKEYKGGDASQEAGMSPGIEVGQDQASAPDIRVSVPDGPAVVPDVFADIVATVDTAALDAHDSNVASGGSGGSTANTGGASGSGGVTGTGGFTPTGGAIGVGGTTPTGVTTGTGGAGTGGVGTGGTGGTVMGGAITSGTGATATGGSAGSQVVDAEIVADATSPGDGEIDVPILVFPDASLPLDLGTGGSDGAGTGGTGGTGGAGTGGAAAVTLDTTIASAPATLTNVAAATFTFTSVPATGVTFQCSLDGSDTGPWTTCTATYTTAALTNGTHVIYVRARDAGGNVDPTPASYTWTVDLTPPDTTIVTKPDNPSTSPTGNFTFSGTDAGGGAVTFECRMDTTTTWTACSAAYTTPALTYGSHTLYVRAVDLAGNVDATPAAYTWAVSAP